MGALDSVSVRQHGKSITPLVSAAITEYSLDKPLNSVTVHEEYYWLDLSLTPRPTGNRGCYVERWGPHRFEPLGSLFLIPPGEKLHVEGDACGGHSSVVCQIRSDAFEELLGSPLRLQKRHLEMTLDLHNPKIRSVLQQLAEEISSMRPGRIPLAEALSIQLCVEIFRHFEDMDDDRVNGGLASWRLRLIDDRLRDSDAPSVRELAELCKMSLRHLTRAFTISRGISIGAHIKETRIEIAKRMLANGHSCKEVASLLGFASSSSFARAFRAIINVTPREFQRRMAQRSL